MKFKRILALTLVAVMVFTMSAVNVFAAQQYDFSDNPTVYFGGTDVTVDESDEAQEVTVYFYVDKDISVAAAGINFALDKTDGISVAMNEDDEYKIKITKGSGDIKISQDSIGSTGFSITARSGGYGKPYDLNGTEVFTLASMTWKIYANASGTYHLTWSVQQIGDYNLDDYTTVLPVEGGAISTITVNPKPVEVTGVTLNKDGLELTAGQYETLTATIAPNDATN